MNNPTEILFIEESHTQAELPKLVLKGRGSRVTAVADGSRALEWVRRNKPAMVISNIEMPIMNRYKMGAAISAWSAPERYPARRDLAWRA